MGNEVTTGYICPKIRINLKSAQTLQNRKFSCKAYRLWIFPWFSKANV